MFNQRSTPNKVQNFTEGNNMKTPKDILYDELQYLKNETSSTLIESNNNINKVENSVAENRKAINGLAGKIEKLITDQEDIKKENINLKSRCENLEMQLNTFKNVKEEYHMLKTKVDGIYTEVEDWKNQTSIEDMIKKSLIDSTDKIKSSMEDSMNKINNLFITNFTNQVVSSDKLYSSKSCDETVESNTVTDVSSIKPIPSILSNNVSPKAPEQSGFNSNKDLSQTTTSRLESISKVSPLKDNDKSSTDNNENQILNNAPVSSFSIFNTTKPVNSPLNMSNLTSNQGTNQIIFGMKQQTNTPADFNKSANSGSLFSSAGQTNKLFGENPKESLFGNKAQPNKLFGEKSSNKESIFGNKDQPNKLFGNLSDPNKSSGEPLFSLNTNKSSLFNCTDKPISSESIFGLKSHPNKLVDANFNKEPNSNLFSVKTGSQLNATEQSNKPLFSFTSAVNSNTPSFSSLSQSATDSFVSQSEATWQGGSKLFANKLNTSENEDNVEQNQEEDHDPHFQPIIELPPLVALQKDEESHEILFKSRCKLYRFTGSEWKERGVGEMKIMRTKESVDPTKPVKLLMRRDQVRKICCNQRISKNVPSFAEMPNVKSTCWVGNDYSDGEPTQEKFAIRFSHADELAQFKRVVEEIQAEISSVDKTD